jgi:hypothetical protein
MKKSIRIGNAGGFWGDDLQAFRRQLLTGSLDYLTMDYLAEITMSILRKQRMRDPGMGYIPDFVDQVVENADALAGNNIRIITNAGGINPVGCAKKIIEQLQKKNIFLRLAVIDGDDLLGWIGKLYPVHADFKNMETGESFDMIRDKIQSANAYLGIPPLLEALASGAQIIITGRVTDTSITMSPMVHEFGWKLNDWDRLASALVAGHIIECGAQTTGGNFTDWKRVSSWGDFGYPIVEVYPDGSFDITKPAGSGGIISEESIKEQIVYEMGDPAAYISPDVVADFTSLRISRSDQDRIHISGVKGYPSTYYLKVSMAYEDGFTANGSLLVSGPDVLEKGKKIKEIFWDRLGLSFAKANTEFVGFNASHLNLADPVEPNELLIRFSAYDADRKKIELFTKNLAPLILSGPPGMAVTGGRPRITSVITYWPALVRKEFISGRVLLVDENSDFSKELKVDSITGYETDSPVKKSHAQRATNPEEFSITGPVIRKKLVDLCLARSGDKGDTANLGVIARSEAIYKFLREYLTAGIIKNMFRDFCHGEVIRYELDNLLALNFLLKSSLDEGGTKSLRIDAQGKTLAQAFLNQHIPVPEFLLKDLNPQ